jgi:hypothetical protein
MIKKYGPLDITYKLLNSLRAHTMWGLGTREFVIQQ